MRVYARPAGRNIRSPLAPRTSPLGGRRCVGCAEGYLARWLAARGAHVTGIDLSARLIACPRQMTSLARFE